MADRKEIDMEKLAKLAQLPIRAEDIGYVLGVSTDTLSRRIKEAHDCTFAEYLDQKRATIRYNLMAKQFEVALKGDKTMLIWLGKQYLGQRDKSSSEVSGPEGKPLEVSASNMTDEQLNARFLALLEKAKGNG